MMGEIEMTYDWRGTLADVDWAKVTYEKNVNAERTGELKLFGAAWHRHRAAMENADDTSFEQGFACQSPEWYSVYKGGLESLTDDDAYAEEDD